MMLGFYRSSMTVFERDSVSVRYGLLQHITCSGADIGWGLGFRV